MDNNVIKLYEVNNYLSIRKNYGMDRTF